MQSVFDLPEMQGFLDILIKFIEAGETDTGYLKRVYGVLGELFFFKLFDKGLVYVQNTVRGVHNFLHHIITTDMSQPVHVQAY